MIKRFLITTADECTWPDNQPVLFLGEWCRLYNRKVAWKHLDAEVVPYHWDDREQLYRDYLYIRELYETLLVGLTAALNAFHGVQHSLRYWRILTGPWLRLFVQMLFDRWTMLERAVKDYSIAGVRIVETAPDNLVPNDMDHFCSLFIEDTWNEVIYGQLIQGWTSIPVTKIPSSPGRTLNSQPLTLTRRIKRKLARAASVALQWSVREDEAFFIATYLPLKQDLKLQWRLGQIPKIWRAVPTPKAGVLREKRQWKMDEANSDNFSAIVRTMIPKHIPVLYLEGYAALQLFCSKLPWPKKPSLIFTTNSFSSDDVFKAWAAEKIDAGAPLVVGQHGGGYGISRWASLEDHELAISDKWLSWGWEDKNNTRIKPVGNLKMIGRKLNWNPKGGALMVEAVGPRYSYHMHSIPMEASQWLDYFEDQYCFVSALPKNLRKQLLVRLYMHYQDWRQKQRWQERFPDIRLDEGVIPIAALIEKSRLYISTYNATTYLESLAMNIPTIIFWNPKRWELRDSALPYFEQMKLVGIFHETPESAAQQMALVWDDVADWWNSEPVQSVREAFCHRYSRMPERPLDVLEQTLKQAVGNYKLNIGVTPKV